MTANNLPAVVPNSALTGGTSKSTQSQRMQNIEDAVNQWQSLAGNMLNVSQGMINNMVLDPSIPSDLSGSADGLFQIGQYLSSHWAAQMSASYPQFVNLMKQMPWAQYGLTSGAYRSQLSDYSTTYKELTGQVISDTEANRAFQQGSGQFTAAQYQQSLENDPSMQAQFGWLKYGMNYQQLQQQKLQWQQSFGHTLTDAEAVTQLQYDHANSGGTAQARLTPASPNAQQTPQQGGLSGTSAVR